jgi:hypothetical protein
MLRKPYRARGRVMQRPHEHELVEIPEWNQSGTIADGGYKYGSWSRQTGRVYAVISQGAETKEYWVEVCNTYHGRRKTLRGAVALANREFNKALQGEGKE